MWPEADAVVKQANLPPMPSRAIRAFVWDLADEGLEEVLHRLHESGIDGIHLALAYHGGRFYCPHNPKRTLIHAPDGVLYFQPMLSCYEGIKPRVHPEYGSGSFVGHARDMIRDYGMTLTAWIVLFNNNSLSTWHPDCTVVNALGDRLDGALCPANPAVRTYAQALVEDLAVRVGVDAIELEDFTFPAHDAYTGPIWQGVPIGPALGYLLSLCFCEHCRRRAEEANVEVDALEREIERLIRAALLGDLSERRLNDDISDPYHPLWRYGNVRTETITSLIDDLAEAVEGSPTALQLMLNIEPDHAAHWGLEPHALRQRGLRATLATGLTAAGTTRVVERYRDLLQLGRDVAADIRISHAQPIDLDFSPATAVETCLRSGIERFVFSHYGLAHLDMLDWVGALAERG